MFFGRAPSRGKTPLWHIPVAGAVGILVGCSMYPDRPIPPGIYGGGVSLTVTSVFTPVGGEPNTVEETRVEPIEVAIGPRGIPETENGPVKVGDEFEHTVEDSALTFTVTEIMVNDDNVVIAYDITLSTAGEAPAESIGGGSDTYRSEDSGAVHFSRQWQVSNTKEQGVSELRVVGSGDLTRE